MVVLMRGSLLVSNHRQDFRSKVLMVKDKTRLDRCLPDKEIFSSHSRIAHSLIGPFVILKEPCSRLTKSSPPYIFKNRIDAFVFQI